MVVPAAEQSKTAGNAAFKAQDYPLAISHYSTAIALDPSISTYPLNRALVYLKLNQYKLADKDATTALDLDGGVNVKTLFRRGLARKGLGKLEEAKQDFIRAIQQGAGEDVKKELEQINKLLDSKKSKLETSSSSTENPPPSSSKPAPSTTTQSKSDRLRAAIASPSSSSTPSAAGKPPLKDTEPPPSAVPKEEDEGFGMKAVSTRKLKPDSTPTSPKPTTPSSATKTPTTNPTSPADPPSTSTTQPTSSSSFAAKKLSRQTRQTSSSPFTLPPPSSSSSRTASPPLAPQPPSSSDLSSIPLRLSRTPSSSTTLTSLESHLLLSPPGSPSRLELLRSLDPRPEKLVRFVGDSLTPDLLSLILAELSRYLNTLDSATASSSSKEAGEEREGEQEGTGWILELLEGLKECRRFETSRMLLSDSEVEVVGKVLERERKRLEDVRQGWGV
ncbi:uncharacterized protein JCM6883_001360 [Sporobolomyces salmoneus]|uniref:uncharacterized protein n=1 Tax=Sporobolomyces salmoneus TaxID=183962 RepID=UPI00317E6B51